MSFSENVDIVKFFRKLFRNFKPTLSNENISLSFQTKIANSAIKNYNPDYISKEITKFLKQLIKYIPQNNKITVLFDDLNSKEFHCSLIVSNTGVNLSRVTEIVTATNLTTNVNNLSLNSTEFYIDIPLLIADTNELVQTTQKLSFSPFYLEMGKRLSSHFTNRNNSFTSAVKISKKETSFLNKINAILSINLEDNTFKVEKFASEMAMSRTQLFRKMKKLTNMSPSQYIIHFRLQAAKELLFDKNLDLNISDVCYSVGFISKSHFTRTFKKQFGMLPSQINSK